LLALAGAPKAAEQAIRGELMADVVDLLQGAPDLLAFGRDQDFVARAEAKGKQLARLARRRALTSGAASGLITLCIGASVVGVLALAVNAVRHHQLEGIMIAALPLAAIGAFEAVPPVAAAFVRLADVVAAGRRLLAIADIEPPVSDPLPGEEVLELPSGCPPIGMRDVRVRYGRNLPWALDGVTLDIAPGSRSALTGPSGSGKTSVINLLMRFWPFEDGTTTIAGVPLERLDQRRAREVFGLVTQDAHLFAGTIRQNVTLGRPNAGDEEISRVITLAQLGNWVDSLPLGLDTAIGEDGNRLSGGQRQRIALARALLLDAPILLLDEPTVGLDHQMADQLVSDVLAAAGERSVVLVTHRRQEAEQFDSVLELEDGRVVQRR